MDVATSCDWGILPSGLHHSGGSLCQNRITGDPRAASGRYQLGQDYRTHRFPFRRPPARDVCHAPSVSLRGLIHPVDTVLTCPCDCAEPRRDKSAGTHS
ncbi:hypothetical protein B7P34_15310 [Streptosporangium nondiastaticum]|uniref:Uncharacterized protein n=1 Tax=Streptosporangium nondiastaticum TaxID=35764 RepID=A0A9X7PHD2_9ACTN|nr:hypothetical protein B7P34_15310 [Streptosporangium nondiastaticum]